MNISATIKSEFNQVQTTVQTNNVSKQIEIAPKATGYGSSINGGELLLLSLATCYCNDIFREAAKSNIVIKSVAVECTGEFGAEGEPGSNFEYKVNIDSDAPASAIEELLMHT